jgi:hypothetical protein
MPVAAAGAAAMMRPAPLLTPRHFTPVQLCHLPRFRNPLLPAGAAARRMPAAPDRAKMCGKRRRIPELPFAGMILPNRGRLEQHA